MRKIGLLVVVVLTLFWSQQVYAASGIVNGEGLNWEMSILPKPTPEELERERWQIILENDVGVYSYANDSIVKDDSQIRVLVKTIFTNQQILERLNKQYTDKLEKEEQIAYCQLNLKFIFSEKKYAVEKTEIFTTRGKLVDSKKLEKQAKLLEIPENSFAEAMLEILLK